MITSLLSWRFPALEEHEVFRKMIEAGINGNIGETPVGAEGDFQKTEAVANGDA